MTDAERCKAKIQVPEGKCCDLLPLKIHTCDTDNDDDFFHIICHLDQSLIEKIQKGEYVELEKLLQKPEHLRVENEDRQVLVNKDGQQYWVLYKSKENKITGVKKWEQAFRVYAAVYCQVNPHRSAEIWQYVDIINNIAQKFPWEKVARYDYIFRHLMQQKPNRSWAKTYTQSWTLELNGNEKTEINRQGRQISNSNHPGATGSWKDNCCWKYNRGNCPYGRNCRFEHRCTFCGAYGHPSHMCEKKNGYHQKRTSGSSSSGNSSNSSERRHDKKKRSNSSHNNEKTN